MSETPRDQRELWHEVSRTFEELGEALRVHLSPDAARSPSDPTTPRPSAGSGSPGRPGEGAGAGASDSDWVGSADAGYTEPAPWADPARPGESEGFEDPWAAATDTPPRRDTAGSGTGASGTTAPGTGTSRSDAPGSTDATTAGPAASGTGPSAAAGTTGSGTSGPGATGSGASGAGRTGAGPAGAGATGTGATGTAASGTAATGTGTTGTGTAGSGTGGTGGTGAQERGWRDWGASWGGNWSGGRFANPADWDSARESVRDLGSSVRRIATQAGDAARDPQVRDSAQRAARSLSDAIVTTVEDFANELREHMRNPRWSDPSSPPEPPPVAPIEDNRDDKP